MWYDRDSVVTLATTTTTTPSFQTYFYDVNIHGSKDTTIIITFYPDENKSETRRFLIFMFDFNGFIVLMVSSVFLNFTESD